ncbi:MAG: mRNA surveillance protein pelota [Candidatus Diapherotrites archaeon]
MKILKIDEKNSFLEVIPENLDDLWHLTHVVESGDFVSGSSDVSWKPTDRENAKTERKKVFVELLVEEVELHKYSGQLRVSGTILSGKPEEFVELKAHHTLEFGLGEKVKIKKSALRPFHIQRLKKARESTAKPQVLVVVLDDEEATFAVLKDYGFEVKAKINAHREGKQYAQSNEGKYFAEIGKKISDIGLKDVLVAGPGFTRDNVKNYLAEKFPAFAYSFEAINSVGETGLNELLKRGVMLKAVQDSEASKEVKLVERILTEAAKGSTLSTIGIEETRKALEFGAVQDLLVLDQLLLKDRPLVEPLLDKAEQLKAEIHIVSSAHEAGKELEGLGGVAALLRFKLRY